MKRYILFVSLLLVSPMAVGAQNQSSKPSAAERLSTAIDEQGLDAALEMFTELRKNPGAYEFVEQDFDDLGNELLDEHKIEAAVAVFSLNVEMFPDSPFAYFNLAAACMHSGDRECAKKNLEMVTDKRPTFWLAHFILSDLDRRLERVAGERERSYGPGEQTGLKGPYLGQSPPGLTPEIFAPDIVSTALALNFGCTFSPDGKEFYYCYFNTIMVCRLLDDGWTAPEPVAFTGEYRALEPHITLDGQKLYFIWHRPTPESLVKVPTKYNMNRGIYVCERTNEDWSEPEYVGDGGCVTSSRDGQLYSYYGTDPSVAHIARAVLENGILVKFEPLRGGLADIRSQFRRTAHPGISPDGRTILFDSSLVSGLYAAYLDESGVWSKPVTLSDHGISARAGIANFSPDGKYIFFQDGGDIYWISSEFVERLRPH